MSYKPDNAYPNKLNEDISFTDDWKEARTQITELLTKTTETVNNKTLGTFVTKEILNNEKYFGSDNQTTRSVFRKVIDFGALPNAGTTAKAHGITWTANTKFVRIYGTATDPSTYSIPLPYSSTTLNQNIKLLVDPTNVTIVTGIDYSGFSECYVVLEYIQQ